MDREAMDLASPWKPLVCLCFRHTLATCDTCPCRPTVAL
jgi:hypothetical protein